jgi:hypothetical protein
VLFTPHYCGTCLPGQHGAPQFALTIAGTADITYDERSCPGCVTQLAGTHVFPLTTLLQPAVCYENSVHIIDFMSCFFPGFHARAFVTIVAPDAAGNVVVNVRVDLFSLGFANGVITLAIASATIPNAPIDCTGYGPVTLVPSYLDPFCGFDQPGVSLSFQLLWP